jgi:hypothetical protein
MRFNPPKLMRSSMTGAVYVVTHGTEEPHPSGDGSTIVTASAKHDVTEQFQELFRADSPETATFDSSWADCRPLCHGCGAEIARGGALVLPAGRNVEDDEELVGVLLHRSCPVSTEGDDDAV